MLFRTTDEGVSVYVQSVMGSRIVSVEPTATVQVAIARMLEENVGSVAVCEGPRLVGIFTERDVMRLAGEGSQFGELTVGDVMTRNPVTVAPDDPVAGTAELMRSKGIRHLPVVQGENLLSVIGIRDVMRGLLDSVYRMHSADDHATIAGLLGGSQTPSAPQA